MGLRGPLRVLLPDGWTPQGRIIVRAAPPFRSLRVHTLPSSLRGLTAGLPLVLALASAGTTQAVPAGFTVDTLIPSGLAGPMDMAFLPDGRKLIAELDGDLKLWVQGNLVQIGTIPEVEVDSLPERGLQTFTLDPAFEATGYLYVWFCHLGSAFMRLERYTLVGDRHDPTSSNLALSDRRILLADVPDNSISHNGGTLRFGQDGRLYLSTGEDEQSCQAQNRQSLLGKLLRLDVGQVPAGPGGPVPKSLLAPGDNPWASSLDLNEQLVLAYGLRNPFGLAIDPLTGDLFLGDVGHDFIEEVDRYPMPPGGGALPGHNYGWPWREGVNVTTSLFPPVPYSLCGGTEPPGLTPPIHEYNHSSGDVSVILGGVLRNGGRLFDFGPAYEGDLFIGDYFSGRIRRLQAGAAAWSIAPPVPGQPLPAWWGTGFGSLVRILPGPDGAFYLLRHAWPYGVTGGTLQRIRPLPSAQLLEISGDGQRVPATEPFPQPCVVQVTDLLGSPVVGAPLAWSVTGPASFSSPPPTATDSFGRAAAWVQAEDQGGSVAVHVDTFQGPPAGATFALFVRDLDVVFTPGPSQDQVALTVTNVTTASPPQIPCLVMCGFPQPPLMTPIGPFSLNPLDPLNTIVLEDPFHLFGGAVWMGGIGTPSLANVYAIPSGLLSGVTLLFFVAGYDPVEGLFRTDTEVRAF
jgi:glucose/arabinose dehydrogenase